MKTVITDAYSATNVGDGELVRLSIRAVVLRGPRQIVVLATDPESFQSGNTGAVRFKYKCMSRLNFREASWAGRIVYLVREVSGVGLVFAVTRIVTSERLRRSAVELVGKFLALPWIRAIARADEVVGVGGGYLGDRYARESLLTLITFTFAKSIGASVETMPISVASMKGRVLRAAFRVWGPGVKWRVRDELSRELLAGVGCSSEFVPDLAWANHSVGLDGDLTITRDIALTIAPVGSEFYSTGEGSQRLIDRFVPYLETLEPGSRVFLIAMHFWDPRLRDGADDVASENLASAITARWPSLEVTLPQVRTYSEVLDVMSRSQSAVCERLHAALGALATDTPVTVRGYEPKHVEVLAAAGLADRSPGSFEPLEVSDVEKINAAGRSQALLLERAFSLVGE